MLDTLDGNEAVGKIPDIGCSSLENNGFYAVIPVKMNMLTAEHEMVKFMLNFRYPLLQATAVVIVDQHNASAYLFVQQAFFLYHMSADKKTYCLRSVGELVLTDKIVQFFQQIFFERYTESLHFVSCFL